MLCQTFGKARRWRKVRLLFDGGVDSNSGFMGISAENVEAFEDAREKFNGFVEEELKGKGFDYYILFSVSKNAKGGQVDNLAGAMSSLQGASPWAVVKIHLSNILTHVQNFVSAYQVFPTGEPVVKRKEGD